MTEHKWTSFVGFGEMGSQLAWLALEQWDDPCGCVGHTDGRVPSFPGTDKRGDDCAGVFWVFWRGGKGLEGT